MLRELLSSALESPDHATRLIMQLGGEAKTGRRTMPPAFAIRSTSLISPRAGRMHPKPAVTSNGPRAFWPDIRPFSTGGTYVNCLSHGAVRLLLHSLKSVQIPIISIREQSREGQLMGLVTVLPRSTLSWLDSGNRGSFQNVKSGLKSEEVPNIGRVAQLVRAPASHAGGHRFESCRAHHSLNH